MVHKEEELSDSDKEMVLTLAEAREMLDMVYLINAILQSGGNLSNAARELGIGRRTFYDLMEKYGISYTDGRLCLEIRPLLSCVELQIPVIEKHIT